MEITKKEIMEIVDEKILGAKTETSEFPQKVGDKVFMRTITNYYTGRIVKLLPNWLVLEDAAWIADTRRFSNFLKNGVDDGDQEVEPYPSVTKVQIDHITDITDWPHDLPGQQQ